MAMVGMGAIYVRTSGGALLRSEPDPPARLLMLQRFYEPHHASLAQAVYDSLHQHGRCLIIDCHSFPSLPLKYELNQNRKRPDICIGTDSTHTPLALAMLAWELFQSAGYSVEMDRPFSGSIVPMKHYQTNVAVSSVMIELNRGLYMDERTGTRSPRLDEIATIAATVLEELGNTDT